MKKSERPLPYAVDAAAREVGQHLATWRKLQRLTAQQLAERAGVSRSTVSKLENGDSSVGFDVALRVCRALGVLQRLEDALDPLDTDVGRARADERLPQRVRP
jgi:transcriptional regulator with XRE-family HTH domain